MELEKNQYIVTIATAMLVANDFQYLHVMSKSKDFDKIHSLADSYKYDIEDNLDVFLELAIEKKAGVINRSKALDVIPEYIPENKETGYNFEDVMLCLSTKLNIYLESLKKLRNFATDDTSVQSLLDEMIRHYEREINYKIAKRSEPCNSNIPFINTGLDTRVLESVASITQ